MKARFVIEIDTDYDCFSCGGTGSLGYLGECERCLGTGLRITLEGIGGMPDFLEAVAYTVRSALVYRRAQLEKVKV